LEKVDPSLVDGHDNGYVIKTHSNMCLASNFGTDLWAWPDCGLSRNDERIFLLTANDRGIVMENARYRGMCAAGSDIRAFSLTSCQGQTWVFDPPFNPDHGTPITHPEVWWDVAASSMGTHITKSLKIGMDHSGGHTVTNADQRGFSYALEVDGKFLPGFSLGSGVAETLTREYSHSLSGAVLLSATTTTMDQCTARCLQQDLPPDSSDWDLFQWKMHGTANTGELWVWTCDYLCMPHGMQPRCPRSCCSDAFCQTCLTDHGCPRASPAAASLAVV
jgi:hypothetical protein